MTTSGASTCAQVGGASCARWTLAARWRSAEAAALDHSSPGCLGTRSGTRRCPRRLSQPGCGRSAPGLSGMGSRSLAALARCHLGDPLRKPTLQSRAGRGPAGGRLLLAGLVPLGSGPGGRGPAPLGLCGPTPAPVPARVLCISPPPAPGFLVKTSCRGAARVPPPSCPRPSAPPRPPAAASGSRRSAVGPGTPALSSGPPWRSPPQAHEEIGPQAGE